MGVNCWDGSVILQNEGACGEDQNSVATGGQHAGVVDMESFHKCRLKNKAAALPTKWISS